jgi:surface antigen
MKTTNIIALAVASLALQACSSTQFARGTGGAPLASALVAGGSAGGGAGQQIAATIMGAMAGGLIGGPIGNGLDARDRRAALEAEYRALEYTASGEAVSWRGADARRYGEVVAGQPYSVGAQNCRQYSHTVFTGGQTQAARGAACRNADGSWTPLS